MKNKDLTKIAIVAAVYFVASMAFPALQYSIIQFRYAEILMVLPFYDKKYSLSLIIGCFLVNIPSPLGVYDMVFGTLATALACYLITKVKDIKAVPIIVALVNGLIIGPMLYFVLNLPLVMAIISVIASEFIIMVIGILVFQVILNNQEIKKFIQE